jgi:hypothetical protein
MVTFRNNNNRRSSFRANSHRRPSFRSNSDNSKYSNNDNFQRKMPGRNNHNASKLIEKYNDLAREALANEDKILSENYFQHADHFTRIQKEQENNKINRTNNLQAEAVKSIKTEKVEEKTITQPEIKKTDKIEEKKVVEKNL